MVVKIDTVKKYVRDGNYDKVLEYLSSPEVKSRDAQQVREYLAFKKMVVRDNGKGLEIVPLVQHPDGTYEIPPKSKVKEKSTSVKEKVVEVTKTKKPSKKTTKKKSSKKPSKKTVTEEIEKIKAETQDLEKKLTSTTKPKKKPSKKTVKKVAKKSKDTVGNEKEILESYTIGPIPAKLIKIGKRKIRVYEFDDEEIGVPEDYFTSEEELSDLEYEQEQGSRSRGEGKNWWSFDEEKVEKRMEDFFTRFSKKRECKTVSFEGLCILGMNFLRELMTNFDIAYPHKDIKRISMLRNVFQYLNQEDLFKKYDELYKLVRRGEWGRE